MGGSRDLMFGRMARYYDLLYAQKDYRSESERLMALARRFGRSKGTEWLDVACGTGRHLGFLRRRYSVTGVDLSPAMLRIARRRLPGIRLRRGDMSSFRLGARFDVVTCLFSAIGHLRTEGELRTTFRNFARHLKPGGVALVEPWIDPSDFRPGFVHLVVHESPTVTVVRMAYSKRRANHSAIRYHYLVGAPGRGIRSTTETDIGLLVPRSRLLKAMEDAGLRSRFVAEGLTAQRGLLVGVKGDSLTSPG